MKRDEAVSYNCRPVSHQGGWASACFTFLVLTVFSLFSILSGCGYRFLSGPAGEKTSDNALLIYSPLWENRTNELGLESTIHSSIFDWISESGHFAPSADQGSADYILLGKILSVEHPGSSYGTFDQATGLKAVVRVSFMLKNGRSDEVIWQQSRFQREESYLVQKNAVRTLGRRKEALKIIADEIAEEIYVRLLFLLDRPVADDPTDLPTSSDLSEE